MPHGLPDFGATSGKKTTYQVMDMAELAARLGSIDTFDRLGDVVFLEDFEAGIAKADLSSGGTGAGHCLSCEYARGGQFSLRLTAGSDGLQRAVYTKYLVAIASGKLGFEVSFTLSDDCEAVEFNVHMYTGSEYKAWSVVLHLAADELRLLNSDGDVVYYAALPYVYRAPWLFNTLKLVVDPAGDSYSRLLVNGSGFDLTAVDSFSMPATDLPYMYMSVRNLSKLGENPAIYLDDVIVTQNEP